VVIVVGVDARVPALRTVAVRVIGSVSTGDAGAVVRAVTVRSGLAAGTPMTWSSATCPPGAPVLAVNRSRTSVAVAVSAMVAVLPVDGLNAYAAAVLIVVNPVAPCARPSTSMVWLRGPQAASGLSLTTTAETVASVPNCTVRVLGTAPSQ
jgi:hypothetical protein